MTKPIIVGKMPCKLMYIIQVKRFLMKGYNFLTLPDIKVFGCLWPFAMLLLIGLALFL